MTDRLYLNELQSYKNATEKEKKQIFHIEKNFYDFEKVLDTYIQQKLKEYVLYNTEHISATAAYRYVFLYNRICAFFNDPFFNISLENSSLQEVLQKYRAYLLKKGLPIFQMYRIKHTDSLKTHYTHAYSYLQRFLKYVYEDSSYILKVEEFPGLRNNPANPVKAFNLSSIKQKAMRDEVKEAVIFSVTYKSARSIKGDIYAANVFSKYMKDKYSEIKSFSQIRKLHISDFIIYLKVESGYKAKTYCTIIGSLKNLLSDIGMIYNYGKLESYFSNYEYRKGREPIERIYSKYELQRFNKALKSMEPQLARCIMLHQLLGLRISDTLLLKQDCLIYKNGKPVVRINQSKVERTFEKPINLEIAKLIEKSISYTKERYGVEEYIFVNEKNPDRPISYGKLKYWAEEMIRTNHLKDDNGETLFFGTHVFRRYYGRRLTELHVDDVTIAKLLGHSDTKSVNRYRKIGDLQIAQETRAFRNSMDVRLRELITKW